MRRFGDEDYSSLRRLPAEYREQWFLAKYPEGQGIQWWLSIVESAESEVRMLLREGESARETFDFAASILEFGSRCGVIDEVRHSSWLLRFASAAVEFEVPLDGVPKMMTPDNSARHALSAIPLSPEGAIDISWEIDREFEEGIERAPDSKSRALGDVVWLISSLEMIFDAISDPALRGEIRRWWEVYEKMRPSRDDGGH